MKINLRLPNDLADQIREQAEAQDVSMNTLMVTLLAGAVSYSPRPDEIAFPRGDADDKPTDELRLS
jgi:Arc-like DNA binding domain